MARSRFEPGGDSGRNRAAAAATRSVLPQVYRAVAPVGREHNRQELVLRRLGAKIFGQSFPDCGRGREIPSAGPAVLGWMDLADGSTDNLFQPPTELNPTAAASPSPNRPVSATAC